MRRIIDLKQILGVVFIAILFILASFLSTKYSNEISLWLDIGVWGMVVYILLGFIATVVAPISTLPLLPIAASLWGPLITAFLSILSWFAGSLVAFAIARKWGKPIVLRLVDMKKLSLYEKAIGDKHVFWNIVFLRLLIPVDILSYVIGIFSTVGWKTYLVATLIGISPFAFMLSYASKSSIIVQISAFFFVMIMMFIGYRKIKSNHVL